MPSPSRPHLHSPGHLPILLQVVEGGRDHGALQRDLRGAAHRHVRKQRACPRGWARLPGAMSSPTRRSSPSLTPFHSAPRPVLRSHGLLLMSFVFLSPGEPASWGFERIYFVIGVLLLCIILIILLSRESFANRLSKRFLTIERSFLSGSTRRLLEVQENLKRIGSPMTIVFFVVMSFFSWLSMSMALYFVIRALRRLRALCLRTLRVRPSQLRHHHSFLSRLRGALPIPASSTCSPFSACPGPRASPFRYSTMHHGTSRTQSSGFASSLREHLKIRDIRKLEAEEEHRHLTVVSCDDSVTVSHSPHEIDYVVPDDRLKDEKGKLSSTRSSTSICSRSLSCFFFLSLSVFTFILVMSRLGKMADLVINKGVDLKDIFLLVAYSCPPFLTFTLPMAFPPLRRSWSWGGFRARTRYWRSRQAASTCMYLFVPISMLGLVVFIAGFLNNSLLLSKSSDAFRNTLAKSRKKGSPSRKRGHLQRISPG